MVAVFVVKRTLFTVLLQTRMGSLHLGIGLLKARVGFVVFRGETPAGKDMQFLTVHAGASLSRRLCWAPRAVAAWGEGPLRRKAPRLAFELKSKCFNFV